MVRNILSRSSHNSKSCRDEVCWICKSQTLDPPRRELPCPRWLCLLLPSLRFCSTDFRVAMVAHAYLPCAGAGVEDSGSHRGCSHAVTRGSWYIKCHTIFLLICLQVPGVKGCIQNRFIRTLGSSQNWRGGLRTKGKGAEAGTTKESWKQGWMSTVPGWTPADFSALKTPHSQFQSQGESPCVLV